MKSSAGHQMAYEMTVYCRHSRHTHGNWSAHVPDAALPGAAPQGSEYKLRQAQRQFPDGFWPLSACMTGQGALEIGKYCLRCSWALQSKGGGRGGDGCGGAALHRVSEVRVMWKLVFRGSL